MLTPRKTVPETQIPSNWQRASPLQIGCSHKVCDNDQGDQNSLVIFTLSPRDGLWKRGKTFQAEVCYGAETLEIAREGMRFEARDKN